MRCSPPAREPSVVDSRWYYFHEAQEYCDDIYNLSFPRPEHRIAVPRQSDDL